MPETLCPVSDLIGKLAFAIDSGRLTNPRDRRRAEDVLRLLRDVAWGGADRQHMPTMESLAAKLEREGKSDASIQAGQLVGSMLTQYREIGRAHV